MLGEKTLSRICLFFGFIWLLSNASKQGNGTEEDEGRIVCNDKHYLDRCLSKIPKFVNQSLMRRMPVSDMEIDSLCGGFHIGMRCINRYSSKCLDKDRKRILEQQVSGARRVFSSLCKDESFRSEYLRHTLCLKETQKNWETCVQRFTQLVQDEIMYKNHSDEMKMLQNCCAIHGFSRCIYVPGRLKCHKDAALFLLKIADMSIGENGYLRECGSISNYKVCAGSAKAYAAALLLIYHLVLRIY